MQICEWCGEDCIDEQMTVCPNCGEAPAPAPQNTVLPERKNNSESSVRLTYPAMRMTLPK